MECRPCFGTALQQCINTAISAESVSELAEVLAKCRTIAEYFRSSLRTEEQFESTQLELGLPQNKLKLDYPPRWNSTVIILFFFLFGQFLLSFMRNFVRVATNLENLEYSGISLNVESSENSVKPQGNIVTNRVF